MDESVVCDVVPVSEDCACLPVSEGCASSGSEARVSARGLRVCQFPRIVRLPVSEDVVLVGF